MSQIKVVFTGGGSGGHIMPLVSIIRELKNQPLQLHYIGPQDKQAFSLFSAEHVIVHPIMSGKIRNYFSFSNIIDMLFKIPFSFVQSFFILLIVRPQLVFSKGGTGSVSATYGARLLGIPVFVHESDAVVGKSNKITAGFAKKIFTSFPQTVGIDHSKAIVVGNPIRTDLLNGNTPKKFTKPLLIVWGGSQGAKSVNDFIVSMLSELLKDYEIVHACGGYSYKGISAIVPGLALSRVEGYHLYESLNEVELKNLLPAAEVIVSRAGAGSIFEIAAFGKPSVLIPLPSTISTHQLQNAKEYAATGAAMVVSQEQLNRKNFLDALQFCKDHQKTMSQAARSFAKTDAAQRIADSIKNYVFQEKK